MDYSLKTISIGVSGGDLNFEGLKKALPFKRAMHSAMGSEA
jgi:hypothetical protein